MKTIEILKEKVQELVDYASENFGNDVLLAQTTDDLLSLFQKQREKTAKEVLDLINQSSEAKKLIREGKVIEWDELKTKGDTPMPPEIAEVVNAYKSVRGQKIKEGG